jgi:hypothetical protein
MRNAWNFASAVDNEWVEQGERYFDASRQSARFYVFHSKNDPMLRAWYRVGDFFRFRHGARLFRAGGSARYPFEAVTKPSITPVTREVLFHSSFR